jgi:hypothetical protein
VLVSAAGLPQHQHDHQYLGLVRIRYILECNFLSYNLLSRTLPLRSEEGRLASLTLCGPDRGGIANHTRPSTENRSYQLRAALCNGPPAVGHFVPTGQGGQQGPRDSGMVTVGADERSYPTTLL